MPGIAGDDRHHDDEDGAVAFDLAVS